MSQHGHEELEMGQHLDQALRTTITGVAQLVETLARSTAQQDQLAAQALRERLLHDRLGRRETPDSSSAQAKRPDPLSGRENGDGDRTPQTSVVDHTSLVDQTEAPPLSRRAREYLDAAGGETGADRTGQAWATAVRDLAHDPLDSEVGAAVDDLGTHARQAHGLDLAAAVPAALNAGRANAADRANETAAAAMAAREEGLIELLPAYRDNKDRGVSPTKAGSAQERLHREQTWDLARREWEAGQPDLTSPAARTAAWQAMPMEAKTPLYWRNYDTETARRVPAGVRAVTSPSADPTPERGVAPSSAPTAAEREHRQRSWQMARGSFRGSLPEGTTAREVSKQWEDLDWPDKAVRYWTAYDDPASLPSTSTTTSTSATSQQPTSSQGVSRDRIVALNGLAADYFTAQAGAGSKGRVYLEERIGSEALDNGAWRTGYAPAGWTNLTDHLRTQGATTDEILAAGLGRVSSRGSVIDAFRDRAMVAVRDVDGDPIGFVGRDLSGSENAPKYINTGDTAAYRKGEHLLGLHEAPAGARLVRVEGPFDAMAISAAGEGRYAGVSTLGTALTGTQADHLAERAGGRLWEALDGDRAGNLATERDFWLLRERGVDPRVLPVGKDPAQLWQDDPSQLRTILDVADAAPSSALAVIDNAVSDLQDALVAGEANAYDDLAATQDKVTAGLSDQDRSQLAAYTREAVAELQESADNARTEIGHLEATGEDAAAAALSTADPASDNLQDTAEAAQEGSDRLSDQAEDLDAAGRRAAASTYDRSTTTALTNVPDPEAVTARQASAPGFAQPTRTMLSEAQNRSGTPATVTRTNPTQPTKTRTPRV